MKLFVLKILSRDALMFCDEGIALCVAPSAGVAFCGSSEFIIITQSWAARAVYGPARELLDSDIGRRKWK